MTRTAEKAQCLYVPPTGGLDDLTRNRSDPGFFCFLFLAFGFLFF